MVLPIVIFVAFALIERWSRLCVAKEPHWILRGAIWTGLIIWFAHVFGGFIHHHLHRYALVNLSDIGLWAIIPAIILYEFIVYGYHRALHGVPMLWRMHNGITV